MNGPWANKELSFVLVDALEGVWQGDGWKHGAYATGKRFVRKVKNAHKLFNDYPTAVKAVEVYFVSGAWKKGTLEIEKK